MSLGICLKGLNAIHFGDRMSFVHEFIPQILLLMALFGYMDILIIAKWLTNYGNNVGQAPSVITNMINLALNGGEITGQPFLGSKGVNKFLSNIMLGKYMIFYLLSYRLDLCPLDVIRKTILIKEKASATAREWESFSYRDGRNPKIEI